MSQQGGMRPDELGVMVPFGSSASEKELIRLPGKANDLAPIAGTLLRSRIKPKLRGYYGLVASLAGNHEPTQAFLINMSAAGLGEEGFARNEFLMGLSRMLVPSAMPAHHAYQYGGDGQSRRTGTASRSKKEVKENDE